MFISLLNYNSQLNKNKIVPSIVLTVCIDIIIIGLILYGKKLIKLIFLNSNIE